MGYTENVVKTTSFCQRIAWRNKLTIDIPISFCTIRTGLQAERTVTNVNHLDVRSTSISFVLGLVYNFTTFKGNKSVPSIFLNPTE